MRRHADHFLRVAGRYPYCRGFGITYVSDQSASLWLDLTVELPNATRLAGESVTGVRAVERVGVELGASYPRRCPSFTLRADFPRHFPHLNPGNAADPPRPCLVDGSADEFFCQYGIVDAGIFYIIDQMCIWLGRAAIGALANSQHGWEPMLRHGIPDELVIDPEHVRTKLVERKAGSVWLDASYAQIGVQGESEASTLMFTHPSYAPKVGKLKPMPFEPASPDTLVGRTITAVFWPAVGSISDQLLADDVDSLDGLSARAAEYGVGPLFTTFLRDLDQRWQAHICEVAIPIGIVLCVRRPFRLSNRPSDIELLPYTFDVNAGQVRPNGRVTRGGQPVRPMRQLDKMSPALLRHVAAATELPPVAVVGCGSVGSKATMHLIRTGARITAVSDNGVLHPHNMARHALARGAITFAKATELADEIERLGSRPRTYYRSVVTGLSNREDRQIIAPPGTDLLLNTTASQLVREALSDLPDDAKMPRAAEIALFGRGDGVFVLMEGMHRNPSLHELQVTLSANIDKGERNLLFNPIHGLTQVQIGDGCGSLTMPMTDMRLSAMTAAATEELVRIVTVDAGTEGHIAVATTNKERQTTWRRWTVPPFIEVPVEGGEWRLRLATTVAAAIRNDIGSYPDVETGGLLIGDCNSRLRTITVVDLLAAPPDSRRSAGEFILGTAGLAREIRKRHRESGGSLFDVGTWHSHLAEQGPSALDWKTASRLANERPPPAVLLIATPAGYCAITRSAAV